MGMTMKDRAKAHLDLADFLITCCDEGEGMSVRLTDVVENYRRWAGHNKRTHLDPNQIRSMLTRDAGFRYESRLRGDDSRQRNTWVLGLSLRGQIPEWVPDWLKAERASKEQREQQARHSVSMAEHKAVAQPQPPSSAMIRAGGHLFPRNAVFSIKLLSRPSVLNGKESTHMVVWKEPYQRTMQPLFLSTDEATEAARQM